MASTLVMVSTLVATASSLRDGLQPKSDGLHRGYGLVSEQDYNMVQLTIHKDIAWRKMFCSSPKVR